MTPLPILYTDVIVILEITTFKIISLLLSSNRFQIKNKLSNLKKNLQINQPTVDLTPKTPFSDKSLYF
jgi:hypothetical protein